MVNFSTRIPDCDSQSCSFGLFLSSDASICSTMAFPPLGNSDHVVHSVSINYPINSKQNAPFHRVAYGYSRADWNGLCDHCRWLEWSMFHGRISLNSVLLELLVIFVSGFRWELMYISCTSLISIIFRGLCCWHIHRNRDGVVLEICLDHKFQLLQEDLNCESLAYNLVT